MGTLPIIRDPAWRHGLRLAGIRRAGRAAPRRLGAAPTGAHRRAARGHLLPAGRCRSLPRLSFGLI